MIIRLLTENRQHERIRELCAKYFDGFTFYYGMGVWKGAQESSLTIEIALLGDCGIGDPYLKSRDLAMDIKSLNNQEAVLIEYIESRNELV